MPQEGTDGATPTEQTVNVPTVPTPSPMNIKGLTEVLLFVPLVPQEHYK